MTSTDHAHERADFAGIQALMSRAAGYSVAKKCLEVQTAAEAKDPSLRTEHRVALHADAWSWYQGALGEIEVGRMLAELGPDWFVRHAVPIGKGTKDVDHLVIGPGGVFAVNTKHHADAKIWVGDHALRVNNKSQTHISAGIRDGTDVSKRLSAKAGFAVVARPVVALFGQQSLSDSGNQRTREVAVLDATTLVAWLKSQPQVLSSAELALIKLAAEEPQTWHIDPHAADTLRVMPRFERLVADVGTPQRPTAPASRLRTPVPLSSSRPSKPTRSRPAQKPSARGIELVKLWVAVALIIIAIATVRGVANQPCTSMLGCMLPPLYLGMRPLLILVAVGALGFGGLGTLIWLVRRLRR